MPIDVHPRARPFAEQKSAWSKKRRPRKKGLRAPMLRGATPVANVKMKEVLSRQKPERQHRGGDTGHQDERATLCRRDCASVSIAVG